MKVEIWSDFQCPFCFIGERQFEAGLAEFAQRDDVEVEFRSFELDPNAPVHMQQTVHEMLSKKYGMSVEQAKQMNQQMEGRAAEVGLTYHMDGIIPTNSLDAHRLTHFAAKFGKRAEVSELLFRAHFTESLHIGQHEVLLNLAEQAGLPREEAAAMLASDAYVADVRAEETDGSQLGIQGVPFFVVNRKYGVSGAQPSHVFTEMLARAWEESQ